MYRNVYNQLILDKLQEYVYKHPHLRFGQLLVDCKIIEYKDETFNVRDPFNEESEVTWNRMCNRKSFGNNEQLS